jgi:hypothetical protein
MDWHPEATAEFLATVAASIAATKEQISRR